MCLGWLHLHAVAASNVTGTSKQALRGSGTSEFPPDLVAKRVTMLVHQMSKCTCTAGIVGHVTPGILAMKPIPRNDFRQILQLRRVVVAIDANCK